MYQGRVIVDFLIVLNMVLLSMIIIKCILAILTIDVMLLIYLIIAWFVICIEKEDGVDITGKIFTVYLHNSTNEQDHS